jgi:PAS domain S-box-containing protein
MTDLGMAAKLQAVFELSPTILAVTDLSDGRIVEVNEAFLRALGYARDEIIGRPISDIRLWVDPGLREKGLVTLRAGQPVRDMEARFRTKSGAEIVAIANADLIEVDGRTCVVTALMDITDRVRAETALRESERRFAQAFDANPLPMSITTLDGRHLYVNAAALRHSGYTREELMNRTKAELGFWLVPEDRDRLLKTMDTEGRVRDVEVTFRTKSGESRNLLVNSERIIYGGELAVLNVSLDITERKQLEAQADARREEAETLARAKDEFLAMLGHELRNPLGAITNALVVLNGLVTGDRAGRAIDIIDRQTAHLSRLVDDLLDVARVTSGKIELRPEALDLRALAERSLDALADAARTGNHQMEIDGEAVWVHGDPARLEQVIRNLLDNALKYTPASGRVRLTVARAGAEAVLRVSDTGAGIRPELLDRIFDLFVQEPQALDRARGGLGLGLTLVKRLIELHGGSVSATSAGPGLGSEFTVRIPALIEEGARDGVAPAMPPPNARRRRVLVVEDSADARESLRLLLEMAGHEVDTSEDAADTLEKVKVFQPDVALIDIGLPGMDGYRLAQALRERPHPRPLRLIALTGYGQAEDRRKALDAGFDLHLTKPVDPDRLQDFIAGD